jgi:hypothetical protein
MQSVTMSLSEQDLANAENVRRRCNLANTAQAVSKAIGIADEITEMLKHPEAKLFYVPPRVIQRVIVPGFGPD